MINTFFPHQLWFAHGFVYYGLALNIGNIGGDPFINLFIFGMVDVPGFLLTVATLTFLPRRPTIFFLMLLCAFCLLGTMAFEKEVYPGDWPIVALAMAGKFGLSITFTSIYL